MAATPRTFHDESNRVWRITIDVPTIRKLRDHPQSGLDLTRVLDDQTILGKLIGDPVRLVDTLWLLVEDQAAVNECDDVGFGRALVGDAIDRATDAFLEALTDFFPPAKRALLKKVLAKVKQIENLAHIRADRLVDSERLDAMIHRLLDDAEDDLFRQLDPPLATGTK